MLPFAQMFITSYLIILVSFIKKSNEIKELSANFDYQFNILS